MDPKMQLAQTLLGKGMAQHAAKSMQQANQYRDYAIEAQTAGQQPLPQNDPNWVQHWQQMQTWKGG